MFRWLLRIAATIDSTEATLMVLPAVPVAKAAA